MGLKVDLAKTAQQNLLDLINSGTVVPFVGDEFTISNPIVRTPTQDDDSNTTVQLTAVPGKGFEGDGETNYMRLTVGDTRPGVGTDYTTTNAETFEQFKARFLDDHQLLTSEIDITVVPAGMPAAGTSKTMNAAAKAGSYLYVGNTPIQVLNTDEPPLHPPELIFYLASDKIDGNIANLRNLYDDVPPLARGAGITLSTVNPKFAPHSFDFTGTGNSRLAWPAAEAQNFTTDTAYTVEFYFTMSNTGPSVFLMGQWDVSGARPWGIFTYQGSLRLSFNQTNGQDIIVIPSMVANQWYHVAISRQGNTIRAFVNGVQVGTQTVAQSPTTTNQLCVGMGLAGAGYTQDFPGKMDHMAIWKGVARYVNNFTPGVPY